jgi:hypothetical protein
VHQQFLVDSSIKLSFAKETSLASDLPSHFDTLNQLALKELLPHFYVDMLNSLDGDEKVKVSKRLLRIYLYAATKMNGKKLYNWLQKGALPQETSYGDSMATFSQQAKKVSKTGSNRDKTIDKITNYRKRLEEKANKQISTSLENNNKKLETLNTEYAADSILVDKILTEIESSLASGKKL